MIVTQCNQSQRAVNITQAAILSGKSVNNIVTSYLSARYNMSALMSAVDCWFIVTGLSTVDCYFIITGLSAFYCRFIITGLPTVDF